ncbi:hypothetical protein RJ639_012703 [Escallonia herrerae]|uniref:Flowering-promoting factor 1-like protein 3 n=1 Tax=Escallonia herrerae TaxID=1293975 RepID=A0AA89AN55_9ASTE|nr:hypothetical protein RJ639_012703 [Escallonia herrerae]
MEKEIGISQSKFKFVPNTPTPNTGGEPGQFLSGIERPKKVLVHLPSDEVITSYAVLERKLFSLGWERYYDDPDLLQFHKRSTVHLISLPNDFNKFKSMHMYDIVVKNRNVFEPKDLEFKLFDTERK